MAKYVIASPDGLCLNRIDGSDGVAVRSGYSAFDPHCVWELVPCFDDQLAYIGYGIKSTLDGKFIRVTPSMPNGGGVGMVLPEMVDQWATWHLRPLGQNADNRVSVTVAATYYSDPHCVLTIHGGGPWKAGDQIISYRWDYQANQQWYFYGV